MSPFVLAFLACLSAGLIVVAASVILRISDKDIELAFRIDAARGTWVRLAHGAETKSQRAANAFGTVQQAISGIGRGIMLSGLLPGKTRIELQASLATSGFRGPNALALFLGSKLVLVFGLPVVGWLVSGNLGFEGITQTFMIVLSGVVGLLAPDKIVSRMRNGTIQRLEAGLPDALDLMVICAQSGLSLNPAMLRVVRELGISRPDITREFEETVRELEIVADPTVALGNLGRRTGLESLKRLGATLGQTIQYGTPLSEALRSLSNELRQETLTRFEERAARLPVLLTLPMILFILPCMFIVVAGPAVIQVMKTLGS